MDFRDRHVIVTGGTGALGTVVVGMLLNAGARCHVPTTADASAEGYPHKDHPKLRLGVSGSLADEAAVAEFYGSVPDLWASIHVAGGYAGGKIGDIDKAALMHLLEINLLTSFLCCRAAVRSMQQRRAGRIVNVAARPALEYRAGANQTAYAASKAGVAALTAALAEEVVKDDILVNAVVPSTMDTPVNRQSMPKANHDNWPKLEEVAQTILFLASPDNKVTRGALVPVYGRA